MTDLDDDDDLGAAAVAAPQVASRAVTAASAGRLDRVLADALPDLSRSRLQQIIRAGGVAVAGTPVTDPAAKVVASAELIVTVPPPEDAVPAGEPIQLNVVHEDDDLIVIDKPAGLVVHPAPGNAAGTLVNALIAHCGASLSGIGGVRRPGIVHRLDKDTSGLMVVAKNDRAHRGLAAQFADHGRSGPLERAYLAVVWGCPSPRQQTIRAPIARSPHNREKMITVAEGRGREAITHVGVEACWPAGAPPGGGTLKHPAEPLASLVRCALETGRTHQIRVHLASIRHPVLGDRLYGGGFATKAARLDESQRSALASLGRQALHAAVLGFVHPVKGGILRFESAPPSDMARLIEAFRVGDVR
jgi:23S rRNA pseudouridine1911/1915/1917 synthase